MTAGEIRVLVVSPWPVVRAGLEAVLARDAELRIVGSVAPGDQLEDAVTRYRPDVILLEREAGEEDGAAPLAWASDGDVPAVVLVSDADDEAQDAHGVAALRAGARAVLSRAAGPATIVAALHAAAAGLVVAERTTIAALLAGAPEATGAPARDTDADDRPPLTPRELEVLAMLAEGVGNKQIAARLAISEHTVKFHLASIYAKLRVSTRTEAVMAGARRGMVMV